MVTRSRLKRKSSKKKPERLKRNKKYYLAVGSSKLSGFYPNDIPTVFSFRMNDWYSFSSKKEAEDFLKRIKKEVNDKDNIERYDEYAKKYKSIADRLKIIEE